MRKVEYIYLHALFAEVRQHLDESGTVPPEAFATYDARAVEPSAIHRRKTDHRDAVRLLTDGIIATLDARQWSPPDARAISDTDSVSSH